MTRNRKKFLSQLLAGFLVLSTMLGVVPATVFAADSSQESVQTENQAENPSPTPAADAASTPTADPAATPAADAASTPTADPTATPAADPTSTPTAEPTATPAADPTSTPTAEPTPSPADSTGGTPAEDTNAPADSTPEVPEETPENTYYTAMLAATSAEELYTLLMSDTAGASALTSEQVAALTAMAEAFPEDAEGQTWRQDLLDTLSVLAGATLEGDPEGLDGSAITISAVLYSDTSLKEESKVAALTGADSTTVADAGAWAYNETRFLYIQAAGIPKDKQYNLVITMQPIIKAKSLPTISSASDPVYVQNTLAVNNGGTYTADQYSGTITWTLNEGTESVGFTIELGYDVALWNKLVGELNNSTAPLLSVYLQEVDSSTEEARQNLHKAQASVAWTETSYMYTNDTNASTINIQPKDTAKVGFSRMINSDYEEGYYYPKLVYEFRIPSYTYKGTTYYLACDYSAVQIPVSGGTADVSYSTTDSTLTITLRNYYTTERLHLNNILLSVPENVTNALTAAGLASYTFTGGLTITQYRSVDAAVGEPLAVTYSPTYTVVCKLEQKAELVVSTPEGKVMARMTDAISYLGGYALRNNGFGDSPEYEINLTFDNNGNDVNEVLVTTVLIMADVYQETIPITYTLMDKQGKVVKTGIYELKNSNYNGTVKDNMTVMFHRGLVTEEDYYLKSISYPLKTVPANTILYAKSGSKGTGSGGGIWGYVNTETPGSTIHSATIYAVDGENKTKVDSLSKNVKVTISDTGTTDYYFSEPLVNGKKTTEIQAGETVTITGRLAETKYPYGNTYTMQNFRFGLALPQGITLSPEDVTVTTPKGTALTVTGVTPPTDDSPLWIVSVQCDALVGYYSEQLGAVGDGYYVNYSITLHTDETMEEQTLVIKNILWAATLGQSSAVSGAYEPSRTLDIYDLNGDGTTKDYVTCIEESDRQFTIKAKPAILDISASIRGSGETAGSDSAALEHFADVVTYDLQIACNDGGKASDFFFLIPIPNKDSTTEEDYVSLSEVNLVLSGEPTVTNSGGSAFELLYAVQPGLDYETAAANETIWMTKEQLLASGAWEKVTMIKVVTEEKFIETGALSVVSVPLRYANDNYQYETEAEKYAANAGTTIKFSSRGYYRHEKGSQMFTGTTSSNGVTVRLEYTVPDVQEITLYAAKDGNPSTGSKTATVTINTGFRLAQNYEVRMVDPDNVNLVASNSDFANLNSNTDFGITVKLNNGTPADLDESASVANPIALGTVPVDEETKLTGQTVFEFEIFNGDALSDTVTPRTVELDIIGHNGVTIPVKITIVREAAPVTDVTTSIIAEKRYLPFIGLTTVSVSQGSALTAQFVQSLIPDNYGVRTLSFNSAPVSGTTILMADCTDAASPQFYHYTMTGTEKEVPLTSFVSLASGGYYTAPTGTAEIKETLLFVVDFSDAGGESSSAITLKTDPAEGKDTLSSTSLALSYTVGTARTFDLSADKQAVSLDETFTVTYATGTPSGTDNRYTSREMALVISGELPVDARLVVEDAAGNQTYYLNAQGMFLVPLGTLGSGSKSVHILSETLTEEVPLELALYVSATSNDAQPMKYSAVKTAGVTLRPQTEPAFEVTNMNERLFVGVSAPAAKLSYRSQDLTGCKVELEIQKKIGSGYVSGMYLSTLDNSAFTSTVVDITDKIQESGTMDMQFNQLVQGTYRILFTVKRDGETLFTVPYNFITLD